MRALLAGFGGIGANVYYPELKKLGYDVDVLDAKVPDVQYTDVKQVQQAYDLAVVCTPNFTHEEIAATLASKGTEHIFIDKPGLQTERKWYKMCFQYPDTMFHLVKNNLYRADYGKLDNY